MQRLYIATAGVLFVLTGCTDTKHTPGVPREQAQNMLTTWLRDEGIPEPANGFEKGQQQRVLITDVYGHGYEPTESYAKLALTDFMYRENGDPRSYTGKGQGFQGVTDFR